MGWDGWAPGRGWRGPSPRGTQDPMVTRALYPSRPELSSEATFSRKTALIPLPLGQVRSPPPPAPTGCWPFLSHGGH